MAKARTEKIVAYLEPFLQQAVTRYCSEQDISYSEHLRKLVIEDLKAKGLLTDNMIAENLC